MFLYFTMLVPKHVLTSATKIPSTFVPLSPYVVSKARKYLLILASLLGLKPVMEGYAVCSVYKEVSRNKVSLPSEYVSERKEEKVFLDSLLLHDNSNGVIVTGALFEGIPTLVNSVLCKDRILWKVPSSVPSDAYDSLARCIQYPAVLKYYDLLQSGTLRRKVVML